MAAEERINMFESLMMQSQMPIDASAIGASMIRPPPFGSAAAAGPNQDQYSMNNEAV